MKRTQATEDVPRGRGAIEARPKLGCVCPVLTTLTVLSFRAFTARNNEVQSHPTTTGIVRLHVLSAILVGRSGTIIRVP